MARKQVTRTSRRGGARPGAGAPRGNLNALKHGGSSAQLDNLVTQVSALPHGRAFLLALLAVFGLGPDAGEPATTTRRSRGRV